MKPVWIILLCILGIIVGYVLLLVISGLFVDTKKEYTKNSRYYRALLNSATWLAVKLLHVKMHVTGLEQVPEGRFVIVSNHRSNFDPILTWYVFKKNDLAFISKEANFHIPMFGRIIRRCCFLAIDRVDPRKAILTIEKAAQLIKDDEVSIGVYPEGTRSKECVLLPFHAGVFKIAQRGGVPVVVMTIEGTEKIHKNVPFKKTDIYLNVLAVLPAEEIVHTKTTEIADQVRKLMEKQLPENPVSDNPEKGV